MRYSLIRKMDISNGQGIRVSLFVSGCTNNCKGCFNKEAQDFDFGQEYTEETQNKILELLKPDYIKGLSLLGGEPFELKNQETVLNLVKKVREVYPNKNIWCYSGSTIEELLNRQNEITNELLKNIDVLVDGRFVEELKNPSLQFRGSENQRIINTKEYFLNLEKKEAIVMSELTVDNEENKEELDKLLENKKEEEDEKMGFIDDNEKMQDFVALTKEEFLNEYSYLTEEEYDNTKCLYEKERHKEELKEYEEDEEEEEEDER